MLLLLANYYDQCLISEIKWNVSEGASGEAGQVAECGPMMIIHQILILIPELAPSSACQNLIITIQILINKFAGCLTCHCHEKILLCPVEIWLIIKYNPGSLTIEADKLNNYPRYLSCKIISANSAKCWEIWVQMCQRLRRAKQW